MNRVVHTGVVSLALLVPVLSEAKPAPVPAEVDTATHFNIRMGTATTDDNGRPSLCLELALWHKVSVEGCGTGSGVLHEDEGGEMAHFRAKWTAWTERVGRGSLLVQPGVGFAELELSRDEPGFQFGSPDGTSAAGAEGALSLQYLMPLQRGLELVASTAMGVAYIRGARELPGSPSRTQTFASLELGVGW